MFTIIGMRNSCNMLGICYDFSRIYWFTQKALLLTRRWRHSYSFQVQNSKWTNTYNDSSEYHWMCHQNIFKQSRLYVPSSVLDELFHPVHDEYTVILVIVGQISSFEPTGFVEAICRIPSVIAIHNQHIRFHIKFSSFVRTKNHTSIFVDNLQIYLVQLQKTEGFSIKNVTLLCSIICLPKTIASLKNKRCFL